MSPASYLAWTQLPRLVEETEAQIIYRPVFVPGIFKATGNSSPILVPAKNKWFFDDLSRFAKRYKVPFRINDTFPMSSVYVMRGLNAFVTKVEFQKLCDEFFSAVWIENQNIEDPDVVKAAVRRSEIPFEEYIGTLNDPANKRALFEATEYAVSRGVFGVPTFLIGTEMHWGQDRMGFVRRALAADS